MKIISTITKLNPMAVFVALIVHVVIGIIWFSVFGKAWSELSGMDLMKPDARWLPLGLIAHIIYTIVLAVIVKLANATTALEGVIIGSMVSVGFTGTIMVNGLAYMKIPFKLFLINFADEFLSLVIAGIILALWK